MTANSENTPHVFIASYYSLSSHLVELISPFISAVNGGGTLVYMMRQRTRELRDIVSLVVDKISREEQPLRYIAQANNSYNPAH